MSIKATDNLHDIVGFEALSESPSLITDVSFFALMILLFIVFGLGLFMALYTHKKTQVAQVKSILKSITSGQKQPRQAANQLASILDLSDQQIEQLNSLRFSKIEPSLKNIERFIRQINHGQ